MYGILGKKSVFFLQNFNTFFCFVNDLSVIFGFLTQKLKTKMHCYKFPRWPLTGQKRRTVVQTFNCNISETIWDRTLKFGTFTYLHIMYICSKSHWNLERWVSGMSHFDVEFPQNISQESGLLQQMSRLSLENIPTDTEASQDEN